MAPVEFLDFIYFPLQYLCRFSLCCSVIIYCYYFNVTIDRITVLVLFNFKFALIYFCLLLILNYYDSFVKQFYHDKQIYILYKIKIILWFC